MSHPTMGAWIEIRQSINRSERHKSRTPRWVRGLKYSPSRVMRDMVGSHPTMGAWIEIAVITMIGVTLGVAPHDGCVD